MKRSQELRRGRRERSPHSGPRASSHPRCTSGAAAVQLHSRLPAAHRDRRINSYASWLHVSAELTEQPTLALAFSTKSMAHIVELGKRYNMSPRSLTLARMHRRSRGSSRPSGKRDLQTWARSPVGRRWGTLGVAGQPRKNRAAPKEKVGG